MTGHELLALLAPPIELLTSLEALFEVKRRRGEAILPATLTWLKLWQDIRSDGVSEIDGAAPAAWAQVGEVVVRSGRELAF